jgi:hypothetical protein
MLAPEQLSKLIIIGEREHDDLPCAECDKVGPILIVGYEDCLCTYDVCRNCAAKLGLVW